MPAKPRLLLLPNLLSEEGSFEDLPASLPKKVESLDGLIAESEKEGRRYLKRFSFSGGRTFRDIPIAVLSEHTSPEERKALLLPIPEGGTWGLISDAGLPCIADPGAALVRLAKEQGVETEAVSGPSSVVLALMLSGLPAQKFFFQGYLPRDIEQLTLEIQSLEQESKARGCTQVCIEAPYRSDSLLRTLLNVLRETTRLSVAAGLTGPSAVSLTRTVRQWKREEIPDLRKTPAVFLFAAP